MRLRRACGTMVEAKSLWQIRKEPDAGDPSKVEGTNEAGRSRPWAFEEEQAYVPFPSPAD